MAKKQGEAQRDATLPGGTLGNSALNGRTYAVPVVVPVPDQVQAGPLPGTGEETASKPPPAVEVTALPLRAQLAFAARCLRRVQPLCQATWPDAPQEYQRAIAEAIGFAEMSGSGQPVPEQATVVHERAAAARQLAPPDSAAAFVAAAAASAVAAVNRAEGGDREKKSPTSAILVVIDLCLEAAQAATFRNDVLAAFWRDFRTLRARASEGRWSEETPVAPDVFGELWPESPPTGWPPSEESGSLAPLLEHPPGPSTADRFLMTCQSLQGRIAEEHQSLAAPFQTDLWSLEGQSFGYEVNRRIVQSIQETLALLKMAVACTQPDCGLPAKLRCGRSGRSKAGSIYCEHYLAQEGDADKKKIVNHGGASKFGHMTLVWLDGRPVFSGEDSAARAEALHSNSTENPQ